MASDERELRACVHMDAEPLGEDTESMGYSVTFA